MRGGGVNSLSVDTIFALFYPNYESNRNTLRTSFFSAAELVGREFPEVILTAAVAAAPPKLLIWAMRREISGGNHVSSQECEAKRPARLKNKIYIYIYKRLCVCTQQKSERRRIFK